jgi:hypothetical protein
MDGDGEADELPPIRAEMAGPTHPLMQAVSDAQKKAEAAEAAANPVEPVTPGSTVTAETPPTPAPPAHRDPLPTLADRQIQRGLPWGLRWARNCPEDCCTPKPKWWDVQKSLCCWAMTKWPLPPLPERPESESSMPPGVVAAAPVFEPMAELPQRVVPPARATVALGADAEGTGDLECPRCLAMNEEGQAYCRECGAVLPGAILTPNQEPVPEPGRDPNRQHGKKRGQDPKKPPRKHDYVAWAVTAGVILIIAGVVFAIWGPYSGTVARYLRLAYQNIVEFINPYEGTQAQVTSVEASSSLAGVLPGSLIDGQSTVFWASAPSKEFGKGSVLTFTFKDVSDIDRIVITPGIQNGQLSMNALATPATMTLNFDDGTKASFALDEVTPSGANRQVFRFDNQHTGKVTLTIDSVYPPEFASANSGTSGEVAISEVTFLKTPDGNPIGQGSLVQSPGTAVTSLVPGSMTGDVPSSMTNDVSNAISSDLPGSSASAGASGAASASPGGTASGSASPSASPTKKK